MNDIEKVSDKDSLRWIYPYVYYKKGIPQFKNFAEPVLSHELDKKYGLLKKSGEGEDECLT